MLRSAEVTDAANRSDDIQSAHIRTPIWFTADAQAFPRPPPGKAQFEHDFLLEALGKEIEKSADALLGQQPAATRGVRWWNIVSKPSKGGLIPICMPTEMKS
jgi:phosphatidylinositol glycan class S